MSGPVKGFTDVTKNNPNLFAFVQGPAKGIIEIKKLVYNGIAWDKARLEWGDYIIFKQKIVHVFMY